MVYALHKFRLFLLRNKFVFNVYHMVLMYLVNKPHVRKDSKMVVVILKI
jgi:hypothetical protein